MAKLRGEIASGGIASATCTGTRLTCWDCPSHGSQFAVDRHRAECFPSPRWNTAVIQALLPWIGALAALLTSLSYIPQVQKAWPRDSTEDLSVKMLVALSSGLVLWICCGLIREDWIIVLANSNGQTLPESRRKAMELLLPLATERPAPAPTDAIDLSKFAGKYSHAPQTWMFTHRDGKLFVTEDGKEFELKRTGKNEFTYDQGQVLFVPNAKGEFEHIFMGLYAARRMH